MFDERVLVIEDFATLCTQSPVRHVLVGKSISGSSRIVPVDVDIMPSHVAPPNSGKRAHQALYLGPQCQICPPHGQPFVVFTDFVGSQIWMGNSQMIPNHVALLGLGQRVVAIRAISSIITMLRLLM